MRPQTTWFISCDANSNDKIRLNLPEENALQNALCFNLKGEREILNLWQCDFPFVRNMRLKKRDWRLTFRVFQRIGSPSASIREAPLWLHDPRLPRPGKVAKKRKKDALFG